MKRKLKICLLLILIPVLLILLTACGSEKEELKKENQGKNNIPEETSIMWEVTSKDGEGKIYLLGSIHIAREEMYPLNETIMNAFNESNALVVEVDVIDFENNPDAILEILPYMLYVDGTTIEDHIPSSLLTLLDIKINSGIEGIEKDYAYYYKPIIYYSIIINNIYKEHGFDAEYGIDKYFLKEAKKRNMEIIELETVEFQYSILDSLSDNIQSAMLASVLLNSNSNVKFLNELIETWEKGELNPFEIALNKLDEEGTENLSDTDLQLCLEYNKILIDDRNVSMTEKAVELLNSNNTYFYIVGAAHMVGQNGIVQQLIEQGYTVEKK